MSDLEIFDLIESIREQIIAKNIEIEQVDFGAGSPSENRSKELMAKGVIKKSNTKEMCSIGLKDRWAQKLYYLVKKRKPKAILELGTCCGFSSMYMAKASLDSVVYTIEGSPELVAIAKENIKKADIKNIKHSIGRFCDLLPELLDEIGVVDFAFIDGHHDRDATIEYFEMIVPYMGENSMMVFDDITWSEGMKEAWSVIKDSDKTKLVEESEKLGIVEINTTSTL